MNNGTKYRIADYERWVRPYVVSAAFCRPKNQRTGDTAISRYYRVGVVPFSVMRKHSASHYLKWRVFGICKKCGEKFESSWHNIWLKKAFRGKEICGKCARREQFTEEWRKHNSESQKKVQGTPEARKRMSDILKKAWSENPAIRQKISDSLRRVYANNPELKKKIGDALRRRWKDPANHEKFTGHNYHHGWFVCRFGRIYFASSWELMFLLWCEKCRDVSLVKRCCDHLPYRKPDGGIANYYPDFECQIGSDTCVVEIKGYRGDIGLVERKRDAAARYYRGGKIYSIVRKADLGEMGIFVPDKKVGRWILDLVGDGLVEGYAFGKNQNLQWLKQKQEDESSRRIEKMSQHSLSHNFPCLLEEWDYEKNTANPQEVSHGSEYRAFWRCKICAHGWQAMVCARTRKNPSGCPVCGKKKISEFAKNRKRSCGCYGYFA